MKSRIALETRYPVADFSAYFAFLETCIGTASEKGRTHEHHIAPKKQFPELEHDPSNLITLTVEDHKRAHHLLGLVVPNLGMPPAAWIAGAAEGGRIGGRISRAQRLGIFSRTPDQMAEQGRKAGRKTAELKIGIHAPGMAEKGGRLAGQQNVESGHIAYLSRLRNHIRWHVNRSIVNQGCNLCCQA